MALIFGSVTGLVHTKLHLNIHNHNRSRPVNHTVIRSDAYKIPILKIYSDAAACHIKNIVRAERNQHHFYRDDYVEKPFWSKAMKDAFWALKSLFSFLVQQPSQLQYVEWPSFQSTLKTATLTLVLVALLIVALASVDSALAFMLAMLLRKPA